ncbi:hypothetical protein [Gleimia hominis]|nr:hypothetical protein [Gleimia hominis]
MLAVWCLWQLTGSWGITGDVNYYYQWGRFALKHGVSGAMVEYPTPAAALLFLGAAFTNDAQTYQAGFAWAMVLLVGAWFLVLWRKQQPRLDPQPHGHNNSYWRDGRSGARAVLGSGERSSVSSGEHSPNLSGSLHDLSMPRWVWLFTEPGWMWALLTACMGPLLLNRFDLVPALLGAAAFLATSRAWAGHLLAWGTAMKLTPITLFAAFTRSWKRAGLALLGTGVGLILISALLGGWQRVFSPLGWQFGRGLHSESIVATAITWVRAFNPGAYTAALSTNNSIDYSGPGVFLSLHVGTVLTVLTLALIVTFGVRAYRMPTTAGTKALLACAITGLLICSNKVFSPQYMIWLLPLWTAVLVFERTRWHAEMGLALAGITAMTQCIYPTLYPYFLATTTSIPHTWACIFVVVRNVALVVWTLTVCWRVWKRTTRTRNYTS